MVKKAKLKEKAKLWAKAKAKERASMMTMRVGMFPECVL